MTIVLVLIGGAVGAPLRYLTDLFIQSRHQGTFPWGTFVVNLAGSFILGAVAGAVSTSHGPAWLLALAGTGFCGALTTFSTFSFETVRLVEEGHVGSAALNVGASLVVGFGACLAGWQLAALAG